MRPGATARRKRQERALDRLLVRIKGWPLPESKWFHDRVNEVRNLRRALGVDA